MPKQNRAALVRVKPPVSNTYRKEADNGPINDPNPCPNGNETLFLDRIKM